MSCELAQRKRHQAGQLRDVLDRTCCRIQSIYNADLMAQRYHLSLVTVVYLTVRSISAST